MPYPDFRALCAELLAEVRSLNDILGQEAQADLTLLPRADAALAQPAPEPDPITEFIAGCKPLPDETMELLTPEARWRLYCESDLQPAPEPPTDEKLLAMAAKAIEPYNSWGIAVGEYESETKCAVEAYGSELVTFARAVLARWGQGNG